MNYIIFLIPIAVLALIIFLVIKYKMKNKKPSEKLFTGNGAYTKNDFILIIQDIFKEDFDNIVKHSKKLEAIFSDPEKGRLYSQALADSDLLNNLKKCKNKSEIKDVLKDWIYKKHGYNKEESKEIKDKLDEKIKNISNQEKNTKSNLEQNTKVEKSANILNPVTSIKIDSSSKQSVEQIQASDKIKKVAEEMNALLRDENIEKLLNLVKELNDKEIDELLNYYKRLNLEEIIKNRSLAQEIIKAKSKKDLLLVIKENMVHGLNVYYDNIKDTISSERKKGTDVKHEELGLMSIPQKIKMFSATFEKEDFEKVRKSLIELENQIKEKQKQSESKELQKDIDSNKKTN